MREAECGLSGGNGHSAICINCFLVLTVSQAMHWCICCAKKGKSEGRVAADGAATANDVNPHGACRRTWNPLGTVQPLGNTKTVEQVMQADSLGLTKVARQSCVR